MGSSSSSPNVIQSVKGVHQVLKSKHGDIDTVVIPKGSHLFRCAKFHEERSHFGRDTPVEFVERREANACLTRSRNHRTMIEIPMDTLQVLRSYRTTRNVRLMVMSERSRSVVHRMVSSHAGLHSREAAMRRLSLRGTVSDDNSHLFLFGRTWRDDVRAIARDT